MVSGFSYHMIGLVDTIFMAQLGEVPLGAVGNATLFYYTLVLTITGLATSSQIIIGRRNGEGNLLEIGYIQQQMILMLMSCAVVAFLLLRFTSGSLIDVIYASVAVARDTHEYLTWRCFGVFPALLNFSFIAFFVGTTNTKPLAIASPIIALTNMFLDYGLIFGHFGLPELGMKGAAIASVAAEIAGTCFYILYFFVYVDRNKYGFHLNFTPSRDRISAILKLGYPIVLQMLIAMGGWFVFFSIIEQLGERPLAVSHIIRAIYLIISIPLTAWADASNTIVSNLIGEKKQSQILPTIGKIALLLASVNVIYILGLNFFPTEVISLFTSDVSLIEDTIPTLRVISISTSFFALAMLLYRSLAGAGKTAICMRIEIVTTLIYLLASFALVEWFNPSTALVWCTEFLYFSLLGGISLIVLRFSKKIFIEV